MKWFGLDPSLAAFGWAVFENRELLDFGTWKTAPATGRDVKKLLDRARRVDHLGHKLNDLIKLHRPVGAAIEGLVLGMKTGMPAVQTLGRVRGLADGIFLVHGLPLVDLRADQVKKAWTGERGASKDDVAMYVRRLFPRVPARADDNATDAIAVGWAGRDQLRIGIQLKSSFTPPALDSADGDLDF